MIHSQSHIVNQQTHIGITSTLAHILTLGEKYVASRVHQYVIYLCCFFTFSNLLYHFIGSQKLFVTTFIPWSKPKYQNKGGQIPKNEISKLILTFGFGNASNGIKKLRALNDCGRLIR